jgi:hypothetical protein
VLKLRSDLLLDTVPILSADAASSLLFIGLQTASSVVVLDLNTSAASSYSFSTVGSTTIPSACVGGNLFVGPGSSSIVSASTSGLTVSATANPFAYNYKHSAATHGQDTTHWSYCTPTNGLLGLPTATSPGWMSGVKMLTVCLGTSASSFIGGFNNGTLNEFDLSGNLLKTITLPKAAYDSSVNSTPDAVAYINDVLLVTTQQGSLLKYTYSTSILQSYKTLTTSAATSDGGVLMLGKPASSIVPIWTANNDANPQLMLWDYDNMVLIDSIQILSDSTSKSRQITSAGIDVDTKTLWICWDSGRLSLFDINIQENSSVKTSVYSGTTPVTGTVYRIANYPSGACVVELSTSISAAQNNLTTKYKDITYFEIGKVGSGGSETADIRTFQS